MSFDEIIEQMANYQPMIEDLERHCSKGNCNLHIVICSAKPDLVGSKYYSEKRFFTIIKNHLRNNGYFYKQEVPEEIYEELIDEIFENSETLQSIYTLQQV